MSAVAAREAANQINVPTLGSYAEDFGADSGRRLGNFPEAFSHLALVEAAGRIILAQPIEELSG